MAFDRISFVPSTAVADNGTFVLTYPAGRSATSYTATGHKMWVKAHQKLYSYGSGNFTIAFSSNPDVTVTYEGSTTIPAGTEVHVELNRYVPGDVAAGTPGDEQPSITLLTDNSGGTAANTIPAQTGSYVEATQETTVASLAGKINEIIAVLRVANIIATP